MISKQRAMGVLRAALVLLALAFCAYGLLAQWDETVDAFGRMSWTALVGAFLAGVGGLVAWMLGWRVFLAGLGSPLPLRAAARISFISGLGKYVPGKVWALVTQMELGREYKVPRIRNVSSSLLAIASTVASGLAVAAVTLPLTSPQATDDYWWLFLCAPVLLACLHPKIVTWGIDLLLRLARRPPLEHPVSLGVTLRAVAWTVLGWVLFGVHTWLIADAAGADGAGLPFLATGAYALAFTAGFLVFIAPNGLGAREAVLLLTLSPTLPEGAPLVVALVSRVLLSLADLTCAGAAFAVGRRRGNEPAPARLDSVRQPMKERS
ncbi:MAG TPA: lysylphosphatidylglycerol synthase domain-containing protein [Thermomonospora sp.]|nr:lysylphosphatidylglycerol synthase domain-containing protein [Thermomonospora sp.]